MMGKTHKLGGVCTGLIASSLLIQQPYTIEKLTICGTIIAMSTIGAMWPDIDQKNSTIGKKHKMTSTIVSTFCKHRGITHAPLIYFLLFTILFGIANGIKIAFMKTYIISGLFGLIIGIMSHLFLDMITHDGIPLCYPFSKKNMIHGPFKSKDDNGKVSFFIIIITIVILLYQLFF